MDPSFNSPSLSPKTITPTQSTVITSNNHDLNNNVNTDEIKQYLSSDHFITLSAKHIPCSIQPSTSYSLSLYHRHNLLVFDNSHSITTPISFTIIPLTTYIKLLTTSSSLLSDSSEIKIASSQNKDIHYNDYIVLSDALSGYTLTHTKPQLFYSSGYISLQEINSTTLDKLLVFQIKNPFHLDDCSLIEVLSSTAATTSASTSSSSSSSTSSTGPLFLSPILLEANLYDPAMIEDPNDDKLSTKTTKNNYNKKQHKTNYQIKSHTKRVLPPDLTNSTTNVYNLVSNFVYKKWLLESYPGIICGDRSANSNIQGCYMRFRGANVPILIDINVYTTLENINNHFSGKNQSKIQHSDSAQHIQHTNVLNNDISSISQGSIGSSNISVLQIPDESDISAATTAATTATTTTDTSLLTTPKSTILTTNINTPPLVDPHSNNPLSSSLSVNKPRHLHSNPYDLKEEASFLRYGDRIQIYASNKFTQQAQLSSISAPSSPSPPISSPSSSESSASSSSASSSSSSSSSSSPLPANRFAGYGVVGCYTKHNLIGINKQDSDDFIISEYLITGKGDVQTGDVVRYAAPLVLIDTNNGNGVWNHLLANVWGSGYMSLSEITTTSSQSQHVLRDDDDNDNDDDMKHDKGSLKSNNNNNNNNNISDKKHHHHNHKTLLHQAAIGVEGSPLVGSNFTQLTAGDNVIPGQIHVSFHPDQPELLGFPILHSDVDISCFVDTITTKYDDATHTHHGHNAISSGSSSSSNNNNNHHHHHKRMIFTSYKKSTCHLFGGYLIYNTQIDINAPYAASNKIQIMKSSTSTAVTTPIKKETKTKTLDAILALSSSSSTVTFSFNRVSCAPIPRGMAFFDINNVIKTSPHLIVSNPDLLKHASLVTKQQQQEKEKEKENDIQQNIQIKDNNNKNNNNNNNKIYQTKSMNAIQPVQISSPSSNQTIDKEPFILRTSLYHNVRSYESWNENRQQQRYYFIAIAITICLLYFGLSYYTHDVIFHQINFDQNSSSQLSTSYISNQSYIYMILSIISSLFVIYFAPKTPLNPYISDFEEANKMEKVRIERNLLVNFALSYQQNEQHHN